MVSEWKLSVGSNLQRDPRRHVLDDVNKWTEKSNALGALKAPVRFYCCYLFRLLLVFVSAGNETRIRWILRYKGFVSEAENTREFIFLTIISRIPETFENCAYAAFHVKWATFFSTHHTIWQFFAEWLVHSKYTYPSNYCIIIGTI